ncbi:AT-rich interactive domain-containing protein 3A [Phoenix dactylifera]|uniref:AT-rich interactive domain-containing protein 3A n=1 Tax=Phoenix dactylifera TaxID=42345 RepID=A0A8B8ZIC4_PHODC|nr:AT-rich interactive domain-containing protein 3A [Phoenix dactylifera]
MSGPTKRERKSKESSLAGPEAEVEALLRVAQDDLLLKLRVDSHPVSSRASSSSSDALDSDLARRFEALKSPSPPLSTAAPPPPPTKPVGMGAAAAADDEEGERILGDDLAARFAALKGSSSGPNPGIQQSDLMTPNLRVSDDEAGAGAGGGGDGVSEKEVEKVMQWAMDAARLDPSKGDGDEDDGESADDDDDEEEEEDLKKKRKEMNKGKPKKFFFF